MCIVEIFNLVGRIRNHWFLALEMVRESHPSKSFCIWTRDLSSKF
jgi:hypothetical protein